MRLVLGSPPSPSCSPGSYAKSRSADLPGLRAIQALGGSHSPVPPGLRRRLPLLSQASTTHFSEPLNHTGALYLAITVFSTVGFGDITPEDDLARIVMSIQMLLDLVVIGAVVRLLTTAAKTGRGDSASPPSRNDASPPPHVDEP